MFLLLNASSVVKDKQIDKRLDLRLYTPIINVIDPDSVIVEPYGKPIKNHEVTSMFGMRNHPILGDNRLHKGVDFAAKRGTNVYSTAVGIVIKAEFSDTYGNHIIISRGIYETLYAHLDTIMVIEDQIIDKDQIIGRVGSTGRSTGSHLHYEISKNGKLINPIKWINGISMI